jgi:hypothetical protein
MTFRRVLLIAMLTVLAFCAAVGVLAVFVGTGFAHEEVLATAIATAAATGLLLPMMWLTAREKLRAGGFTGMTVVLICWLAVMTLCWLPDLAGAPHYVFEEKMVSTVLFTLLMGLPSALALLAISLRWARVAVFTFVGGAVAAYLMCEMGAMVLPSSPIGEEVILSGMTLYGMGTCAAALLVNLGCGDKRYFRWAGVAAAAAATPLFCAYFWGRYRDPRTYMWEEDPSYLHAGGMLAVAAVVMAHINLVLMAKLRRNQQWLQWGTIAASSAAGVMAICAIWLGRTHRETEWALRGTSGMGIVAGCGSLAMIVLTVMNRKIDAAAAPPPGALEATAMDIVCPRCHAAQRVGFGDSTCHACGLQFSIKVTEPRCAACGYLLYKLTGDKCPECGAPLGTSPKKSEHAPA